MQGFMDSMKKGDWDTMLTYAQDASLDDDEKELIDDQNVNDFLTATAAKLTYTIGQSQIDGNNATVPIDIKYFDGTEVIGEVMGEYFTKMLANAFTEVDITDEEASQMLGKLLAEKTKDLPDTFDEVSTEIDCVKVDGKWMISEVNDDILNAMTSNFMEVSEEMDSAFSESTDSESKGSEGAGE